MQVTRLMLMALVVLGWGVAPLQGSVQIFLDRNDFEAATDGLAFEGFNEGFDDATSLLFDDFSVHSIGANPFWSTNEARFVSEGARAVAYTSDFLGQSVRFDFDNPIQIFGIDINDWGTPAGAQGVLTVSTDTGSLSEWLLAEVNGGTLPTGNTIFFGVIDSEPFSSLTLFSNTSGHTIGDTIGLDNLSYGGLMADQIPEPSSWLAWMGLALCGCGFRSCRRKRRGRQSG